MKIQQISYNLDGKRFIEGKISRTNLEAEKKQIEESIVASQLQAQAENNELFNWIEKTYGLVDYELRQIEYELAF